MKVHEGKTGEGEGGRASERRRRRKCRRISTANLAIISCTQARSPFPASNSVSAHNDFPTKFHWLSASLSLSMCSCICERLAQEMKEQGANENQRRAQGTHIETVYNEGTKGKSEILEAISSPSAPASPSSRLLFPLVLLCSALFCSVQLCSALFSSVQTLVALCLPPVLHNQHSYFSSPRSLSLPHPATTIAPSHHFRSLPSLRLLPLLLLLLLHSREASWMLENGTKLLTSANHGNVQCHAMQEA